MQRTDLQSAVSRFLERFTPPRGVAGNPVAMVDEADQIAQAFARFAPVTGFDVWWSDVTDQLIRRMKTRAWPMVSEVEAACRIVNDRAMPSIGGGHSEAVEAAAVDRMAAWFAKFRSQMPGHGKPTRTAEMIRRGVLADLREARFYGFELSGAQSKAALELPPCRAEVDHDRDVMDRLRALGDRMAPYAAEVHANRKTVKPTDAEAIE